MSDLFNEAQTEVQPQRGFVARVIANLFGITDQRRVDMILYIVAGVCLVLAVVVYALQTRESYPEGEGLTPEQTLNVAVSYFV